MTAVLVLAGVALAGLVAWIVLHRDRIASRLASRRDEIQPGPRRILFPFIGTALSRTALDAAIRLCRAEGATLVPAYVAQVPLTLTLDSSLPRQSRQALPILEAIEQRAHRANVPVDARIERGRSLRHAVLQLIDHERFDRIVTAAATKGSDGFSGDDIAWLLDHAPGEIVVLRPAGRPKPARPPHL
jgi:nucleotide-binding universal stress UspA family protein